MTDEKTPDGDYEVGHGRPPKATRWQKGTSGNPKGRPKGNKTAPLNISDILSRRVEVMEKGKAKKIPSYEAMMKKTAEKAIKGEVRAMIKFIRACEQYGLIHIPKPVTGGGVVVAPAGSNFQEWIDEVTELVPIEMP